MMNNNTNTEVSVIDVLFSRLESQTVKISNLFPSDWSEENRVMTREVSPIEGPFSYNNSPYVKGIVDLLDSRSAGEVIAIMKGAQIGMSTGLMENGIGWIIANDPGNILFLVGHNDLVPDAVMKIDNMISNSGIRPLIRSNSQRARNTKTGDTDRQKEFPGGSLKIGAANHGALRNFSVKYGFLDDYENMKSESDKDGDIEKLILQRFVSFGNQKKAFFISTPQLEAGSNIYPIYLKGDRRKYHIPCQCCGEKIELRWSCESELDETKCGIIWDMNEQNELISGSVRYRCYKCNGEFDDSNKKEFLMQGEWIPTAIPKVKGYVSFHISSLYAPHYMDGWEKYVYDYLDANPVGKPRDEAKMKTFTNLCLGLPYKVDSKTLSANKLMNNIRSYEINEIPNSISNSDGNGNIVMLTMGVDIGGRKDDARLDYEVVAWSESGSSYSIDHGSIGTYQPREKHHIDRLRMPLDITKKDNVWIDFEKLIRTRYKLDNSGKTIPITAISIDTGYESDFVFDFYNYFQKQKVSLPFILPIKGWSGNTKLKIGADVKMYQMSRERPGELYITRGDVIKNDIASSMSKDWNTDVDERQPIGFMNFPTPEKGRYLWSNYFSHFEAEEMVIDKNLNYTWKKKPSAQNHLFDCRVYAIAAREIFINEIIFKNLPKPIKGNWNDYVQLLK